VRSLISWEWHIFIGVSAFRRGPLQILPHHKPHQILDPLELCSVKHTVKLELRDYSKSSRTRYSTYAILVRLPAYLCGRREEFLRVLHVRMDTQLHADIFTQLNLPLNRYVTKHVESFKSHVHLPASFSNTFALARRKLV
jgi:hypothetical protein